jgi:hypothetical protein
MSIYRRAVIPDKRVFRAGSTIFPFAGRLHSWYHSARAAHVRLKGQAPDAPQAWSTTVKIIVMIAIAHRTSFFQGQCSYRIQHAEDPGVLCVRQLGCRSAPSVARFWQIDFISVSTASTSSGGKSLRTFLISCSGIRFLLFLLSRILKGHLNVRRLEHRTILHNPVHGFAWTRVSRTAETIIRVHSFRPS